MVYDEEEIKKIVDEFEEMDEEEYENANPELKQLYIRHGLEARKRKYFEKMGMPSDTFTNLDRPDKKSAKGKDTNAGNVPSAVITTDSKKKIKKDDAKGKQSEVVAMQQMYQEYNKNVYEYLINIANNWIIEECEIGVPLLSFNGQLLGATQKKNKSKKSEVMLAMSEVNFADRGFPLTLIQCPCLRYKEAVVNMFKNCAFVQEKLKVEEEFDILQCPVISKEYTVLLPKTMPVLHFEDCLEWYHLDEATIKKCECNQITDLNLLDDSTQDNVLNILSKWHCTCGKKVNSSQTSTSEIPSTSYDRMVSAEEDDAYLYPLPLHCVKAVPDSETD
ncbi:uncharacterized protein LOC126367982 [Pectinophora gossypiella]|uniref:uncharacterized protein LOC126367982 n=1 Tax=Pectinophora gossypiella TaxID=13191 RepID=UPI00214EEE7B|nr:uncharacterized protein LOC126367982 [Pectinophora gossypiella]